MANRWLRVMFVAVLVVVLPATKARPARLYVERNACRSRYQR